MATVYERVRKLTIDQLGIKDDSVTAVSSLSDLGADSLVMVELVMSVEKEFSTETKKLSIPDEEMEKMITVQDIVEYVKKQGFTDYQPQRTNNYASQPRYSKYPNKSHSFINKNNKSDNNTETTDDSSTTTDSTEQGTYKRKYYHRYSNKSSRTYRNND